MFLVKKPKCIVGPCTTGSAPMMLFRSLFDIGRVLAGGRERSQISRL